jgi:hypothetical protein
MLFSSKGFAMFCKHVWNVSTATFTGDMTCSRCQAVVHVLPVWEVYVVRPGRLVLQPAVYEALCQSAVDHVAGRLGIGSGRHKKKLAH